MLWDLDAHHVSTLGVPKICTILDANQRNRYNDLVGAGPKGTKLHYPEAVWYAGLSIAAQEHAEMLQERAVDARRRASNRKSR